MQRSGMETDYLVFTAIGLNYLLDLSIVACLLNQRMSGGEYILNLLADFRIDRVLDCPKH